MLFCRFQFSSTGVFYYVLASIYPVFGLQIPLLRMKRFRTTGRPLSFPIWTMTLRTSTSIFGVTSLSAEDYGVVEMSLQTAAGE